VNGEAKHGYRPTGKLVFSSSGFPVGPGCRQPPGSTPGFPGIIGVATIRLLGLRPRDPNRTPGNRPAPRLWPACTVGAYLCVEYWLEDTRGAVTGWRCGLRHKNLNSVPGQITGLGCAKKEWINAYEPPKWRNMSHPEFCRVVSVKGDGEPRGIESTWEAALPLNVGRAAFVIPT